MDQDEGNMPTKRGGEASLTVTILREIRDEVKELRGDVQSTNARLDQTNERLDEGFAALRNEMHQGFDLLGRRIDNVLLGEHRHEHEELRGRVVRIERHLGLEPR